MTLSTIIQICTIGGMIVLNDRKIVNLTSDTDYYVIITNQEYSGHLIGIQPWNRIILTPASL